MAAYHQGTVWPWLTAAFGVAGLRANGATPGNSQIARGRFLAPLLANLHEAGLGHISEIADGEPPSPRAAVRSKPGRVGECPWLARFLQPVNSTST